MRSRSGKVFIGKRHLLLEQLEERIVFDADASADANQENSDTHDTSTATDPGQSDPVQTDDAAATAEQSAASVDPLGDIFDQDLKVVLISNALDQVDALSEAAVDGAEVIVYDAEQNNLSTIVENLEDLVGIDGDGDWTAGDRQSR